MRRARGLSPRARLRLGGPSCKWSARAAPLRDQRALVIDLAGVTHEHGLPTRTARSPSTASRASPRRATVALAVPRVRPRGRGHQARSAVPAVRGAWPPPPRMRVERAAVQQITAASSVPRAVKDAKLRELVSIAHARGYSPTWAGCASRKSSATGRAWGRCDERRDGDSGSRAPRARRGEGPRALAKFHGADGGGPRGRRAAHALWARARERGSRRHPSRRTGGSSRWRSRPRRVASRQSKTVARTGAAHGRLRMRRAQRRGRARRARTGARMGAAQ